MLHVALQGLSRSQHSLLYVLISRPPLVTFWFNKKKKTKLKLCSQVVFVQVVRNIHEVQLLLSLLGACILSVVSFSFVCLVVSRCEESVTLCGNLKYFALIQRKTSLEDDSKIIQNLQRIDNSKSFLTIYQSIHRCDSRFFNVNINPLPRSHRWVSFDEVDIVDASLSVTPVAHSHTTLTCCSVTQPTSTWTIKLSNLSNFSMLLSNFPFQL